LKPSSRWTPFILLAPAITIFVFVVLVPMIGTIGLSFTRWTGTNTMRFIGFDNYTRAFQDSVYRLTYKNTIIYILATLVLEVAVGFALAGLVSAKGKRTAWYRITFFIPVMLPMVVIAVLWSFVYAYDAGLLNSALEAVGLESLTRVWLGDPNEVPSHPRAILVHPRCDLPDRGIAPPGAIAVSSRSGQGLQRLVEAVTSHVQALLPTDGELAFNRRQASHIEEVEAALQQASLATDPVILAEFLRNARGALDRLTGRAGVEDVLDALFGRFCLGK